MKVLFLSAGILSLGLAFLGAVLPVLPTTPFVLLSAWCFSRSSERWFAWLVSTRLFGPLIRDWQRGRIIRLQAKISATGLIAVVFLLQLLTTSLSWRIDSVIGLVLGLVLTFIWSCPSSAVAD